MDSIRYPPPAESSTALVGFAQSTRQEADLLLRALEDLYVNWLGDAAFVRQAQMLWKRRESSLTEMLGKAAAVTLSPLFKTVEPTGAISETVKNTLQGLVKLNAKLTSGGITLPRLQHEQALALLRTVHELSEKPAILILDALEQSPDPGREVGSLRVFLEHADEWPPLHIFSAIRAPSQGETEEQAYKEAQNLKKEFGLVEVVNLGALDLADLSEQDDVVHFLGDRVPATAACGHDGVLALLDGYPGTMKRWLDRPDSSEEGLRQLAIDAQALRYREIKPILCRLVSDEPELFKIALRVLLLPEIVDEEGWAPFTHVLEDNATALNDLRRHGLLVLDRYPSFGLTARFEYARAWALAEFRTYAEVEVARVIPELAERIQGDSPSNYSYTWALSQILPLASQLNISASNRCLCECAANLISPMAAAPVIESTHQSRAPILVAMGLVNAISDAAPEKQGKLLNELRNLVAAHPGEAAVYVSLGNGIVNVIFAAAPEAKGTMLDELRILAATYPDEPAAREPLAKGLVNVICATASKEQGELLDELRNLSAAYPDDPAIREPLANGLFNAFNVAGPKEQGALLDELRGLAAAHPDDAAVHEPLASGLVNAINAATPEQQGALVAELRTLAAVPPEEPAVRAALSKGLFNAFKNAAPEHQSALLDELRHLASAHPDEPTILRSLATGLIQAFGRAAPQEQGALLDEIRTLTAAHPEGPALRERLGIVLFIAFNNAAPERRGAMLSELRNLASAFPDEPAVRELLAKSLVNAFHHAAADQPGELLSELRNLATGHPDEPAVRKQFAMGLLNAFQLAAPDGQGVLLFELRDLATAYPDEPAVGERLATVLAGVIYDAGPEQRAALLSELRDLAAAHPYEAAVREQFAVGLLNAFNLAPEHPSELLDELRDLAVAHSEEPAVRERLAKALVSAFHNTGAGRRGVLLKELRDSAAAYPDELARVLYQMLQDQDDDQSADE